MIRLKRILNEIVLDIKKYVDIDYHGQGEDREVAGWNYKSRDGKIKLLIIND